MTCPTCKSVGFNPSVLGPNRCSFCDGTGGGNQPTADEVRVATEEFRARYTRASHDDRATLLRWLGTLIASGGVDPGLVEELRGAADALEVVQ